MKQSSSQVTAAIVSALFELHKFKDIANKCASILHEEDYDVDVDSTKKSSFILRNRGKHISHGVVVKAMVDTIKELLYDSGEEAMDMMNDEEVNYDESMVTSRMVEQVFDINLSNGRLIYVESDLNLD